MNCNCITDIQNKFIGLEFGDKKKKITKAKLTSAAMMFGNNKLTTVTNSEFEIEVEGYKKPQTQLMMHSFCPFCGTKIEKD